MSRDVYRYQFESHVPMDEIEVSLALAVCAAECLHGEAQVRLDASHHVDSALHGCIIDAATPVGKDINRLFAGFLGREFDDRAFTIERIEGETLAETAVAA